LQGEKIFIPDQHFEKFCQDQSGFMITIVNPQTNNQIEATVIAFRDSNSMQEWDFCDFALKKSMRVALGGDLDDVAYIEPVEDKPLRTLIFE
jgi:hypothetical protein